MAETLTPRFGLRNWGASTDGPSRTEFNDNFAVLETNAAMYAQGTRAARPAAGKAGRYYEVVGDGTAANNGMIFYDNGTTWVVVGQNVEDLVARASASGNKPLVAKGAAGQTANLQEWQDSAASVMAAMKKDGSLDLPQSAAAHTIGGAAVANARVTIQTAAATKIALAIKAAVSQTADMQEWLDSGGTVRAAIGPFGNIIVTKSGSIGTPSMTLYAESGQTADIQEWRPAIGSPVAGVDVNGNLRSKSTTGDGSNVYPPQSQIRSTVVQAIANNSPTYVDFDTEVLNYANTTVLAGTDGVIVDVDGWYLVELFANINNFTSDVTIGLAINNNVYSWNTRVIGPTVQVAEHFLVKLVAGDVLRMRITHTSGTSKNLNDRQMTVLWKGAAAP